MKIIKSHTPCTYHKECGHPFKDGVNGQHCLSCKNYGDHDFKEGIEDRFFNKHRHELIIDCNKSIRR